MKLSRAGEVKEAAKESLKDVLAQKEALAVSSPPPAKRKRNESSSFENGDESEQISLNGLKTLLNLQKLVGAMTPWNLSNGHWSKVKKLDPDHGKFGFFLGNGQILTI